MVQKKSVLRAVLILILISTLLIFLWPRSFLGSMDEEIKSVSVEIIENTLEHERTAYIFQIGDPEFDEIMEVLERYSYHISTGTIANRMKNTAHIEDNHVGYWLHIYMYTGPNRDGGLYAISSGGTGELIFDHGVYRMGYWGNQTHLNFMSEICRAVGSD